ncbi:hypothetical protein B5K08_22535 [Rhizobium leguminosarum bv. trifolii]|uniref:Twin-arginine translocation signal domain-containing protein n=1 Tax=Rhizobium leguminosarum bv. trifolii TaxID=386 RepID=A0A3E1B9R4_RHILT|nr:hypothetical protein [Rhizobium leguminosarum]RFB87224.1 hypothetical protein B5K08_22535 [Rhizobium leguminosarum bv. trifolii]RFB87405.1 hypothetical protein B5K10_22525 [Rhizobium leguminosarum bv. trifolii]
MQRRTFLGGMAAAAVPITVAAAPMKEMTAMDRAEFHANALCDAMRELSPDRKWRKAIDSENSFVLVVGDARPGAIAMAE